MWKVSMQLELVTSTIYKHDAKEIPYIFYNIKYDPNLKNEYILLF